MPLAEIRTMAKQVDAHSEMAQARQTDGLNVIFDQKSLGSSRSRSVCSSTSSCSTGSSYKGRETRRRYRSSTSSSSGSSSSSRSRSRSHPRCHRRSSRCRCDGRGGHGRSPPRCYRNDLSPRRQYRAYSPSYSRSPSPDRYSRHRRYRSRSRSPRRWDRYRRPASQLRGRFSSTPSRTYRRRSRSRSTGRSVSLSLHDKRALLEAAKANAMRMFGVEKLDLPESVKPILTDKPQPNRSSPEQFLRAKESFQKLSEENEPEPVVSSPVMSPKRKITFSENNFVAKPTVVAPSTVKVTPRVDSIESRKPYGHWIPISSGHNSRPH